MMLYVFFQSEAEHVDEMRDIVKKVVAARLKKKMKDADKEEFSESTESDEQKKEHEDEGNDSVSSESDVKIFGVN